jgi:hypothetical protein
MNVEQTDKYGDLSLQDLNLTIILEYKETYSGTFKSSETMLEICKKATDSCWHSKTHIGDWKISDRDGNVLPMNSKLSDNSQILNRETLFMSQKPRDPKADNLLVKIENSAEKKFFPLGKSAKNQEEKQEKDSNEKEKGIKGTQD